MEKLAKYVREETGKYDTEINGIEYFQSNNYSKKMLLKRQYWDLRVNTVFLAIEVISDLSQRNLVEGGN